MQLDGRLYENLEWGNITRTEPDCTNLHAGSIDARSNEIVDLLNELYSMTNNGL